MNRQKNLSVRFTDDTKAELKKLHESHEIKPAALVRIAVYRFLASYEKDGPQRYNRGTRIPPSFSQFVLALIK